MRRKYFGVLCCGVGAALIVAASASASQPLGEPDQVGGYPSSYILVRLAPGVDVTTDINDNATIDNGPIDAMRAQWNCVSIKHALPFEPFYAEKANRLGTRRTYRFEVPLGTDTPAMVAAFNGLPGVEHVELDGIGSIADTPNDPQFPVQWALNNTGQSGGVVGADIHAVDGWDIFSGDDSMIIAMLDTGIDQTHPDLDTPGRFVSGWNTVDNNSTTTDFHGHGTHTAGIAAGVANNELGIAGINRAVRLMPVRVVAPPSGTGTEAQCADGIYWAVDHGANIISMSLQYYTGTQYFQDAVDYAHSAGVLCIAAAGNTGRAVVAYPAAFPNCMAISATDRNDVIWPLSNFGPEVDMCAPGKDILSTLPGANYGLGTGTSMAAPMVSGAASLIWEYSPARTADDIVYVLKITADDLGPVGFDEVYGSGRLNLQAALAAVLLKGDMNCDGAFNNFDIDPFVLAIVDPSAYAAAYPNCLILHGDMDNSGVTDNFDIDAFVNALLNH